MLEETLSGVDYTLSARYRLVQAISKVFLDSDVLLEDSLIRGRQLRYLETTVQNLSMTV